MTASGWLAHVIKIVQESSWSLFIDPTSRRGSMQSRDELKASESTLPF